MTDLSAGLIELSLNDAHKKYLNVLIFLFLGITSSRVIISQNESWFYIRANN